MTRSQHTPGPWSVENGPHNFITVDRHDGQSVACFHFSKGTHGNQIIPLLPDQREANARLIAAAPELLEALKLARAYMHVSLGSPSWDGGNPYPVIDAALAKAKGEVRAL